MTAFRNPNWEKKSPQSAPNCIAGGRGLTQSLARASSPRATAGRFVESRRATNGFHTRSDARAPIDACGPPKSPILPELCRTHVGLLDARAEFEPGILVLQCGALPGPSVRRPPECVRRVSFPVRPEFRGPGRRASLPSFRSHESMRLTETADRPRSDALEDVRASHPYHATIRADISRDPSRNNGRRADEASRPHRRYSAIRRPIPRCLEHHPRTLNAPHHIIGDCRTWTHWAAEENSGEISGSWVDRQNFQD